MGSCISDVNGTRRTNNTNEQYDAQPSDTPSLSPADFPQLEIHSLLTKLKLKRCALYRLLGIRIEFAGYEQFQLKSKILVNDIARWDVEHLLDFKASEYQMRKKFVVLSVIEDPNKVIGSLKINLYHLATGPYHQDFSVPLPKAPGARLSFNLKIAQMIQIHLKINETKVTSKEREFPGDMFAFSIRSIIGDRIEETNPSYRYEVGFQKSKNKLVLEKDKKNYANMINQKSSNPHQSNVIVENKKEEEKRLKNTSLLPEQRGEVGHRELYWSCKLSKEMPELKAYFPIYDLHCSSFNIIFYYFTPQGRQFSSECYLSLIKLSSFTAKQRKDAATSIHWEERNIQIETKTFDHGRQSGKAKFHLTLQTQKFIKQMQICVRTQKGIQQSSPVFGESIGTLNVPAQLKQLQTLSNEIQNIFIQSSRIQAKDGRQMEEVNKRLKRQKQILLNTSKQSKKMFVYQDQKTLLNGQRQLIQLGFKTRKLLSENREEIASNCWELLIGLMKRGELTLTHIGFTKQQVAQCLSGKASQFLKRKKDVCLTYHRLIIDLLQITFQALQTFNCENQKLFAELFCAYAYFRIPRFRNEVLGAITHADDPEIQEWRGTQFNLTEDSTEMPIDGQNAFLIMFDWQNYFYKVLETDEQYLKTQNKLSELFKDNDWESRMRKRGGAFFAFVRYWVNYVETIAINSKHILWRYFPGYNKILVSFLAEMKSKKIEDYSQNMRQAASSLLSNQKLLNPLVLILFRKTNLNDRIEVFKTFDLLHIFFTSITNRARSLPSTFDLKLLMKGIKSVLQGDSAFGIGKVLLILYNHYKILPVQFRIEVSIFLMTKVFFKVFLHWSLNVRTIFHHLLFIRIYHEASRPIAQLDAKDQQIYRSNPDYRSEIISRYRKLIIILENAQQFSHKIHKTRIDIHEKQTYKKMKKKINQKRRMIYNPQIDSAKSIKSKFKNEREYQYQLMTELAEPKLEKYNSEVLSKSLQVVVQNKKIVKKEEVIMKMKKQNKAEMKIIPRRKLSFFENSLESQLVVFKEDEIIYIRPSLEEFHKINQFFIKYVQKNKDTVPVVKLQLPLDEKEIRPEGLAESDEW